MRCWIRQGHWSPARIAGHPKRAVNTAGRYRSYSRNNFNDGRPVAFAFRTVSLKSQDAEALPPVRHRLSVFGPKRDLTVCSQETLDVSALLAILFRPVVGVGVGSLSSRGVGEVPISGREVLDGSPIEEVAVRNHTAYSSVVWSR